MANTVESGWEHVDKEASDELRYRQGHGLVSLASLGAVVLPLEGDLLVVEGDETAVGDGDAVGVAGEIGEHGLGSGEGTLGVDHPVDLAQR